MNFVSYTFLFCFLPVVLVCYYVARGRVRQCVLLASSYIFYAWWRPDFLLLLIFTTGLDYICAVKIRANEDDLWRRRWLVLSIVINLGVLCYFKYSNFGVDTLNHLLQSMGFASVRWTQVLLPIGISFYTFESMSYTIDVYRKRIEPARDFLDYASFITLFPHLVAGPIIRYADIGPQLSKPNHSVDRLARGIMLFMIGFSKKVLIADTLAPLADAVFDAPQRGMTEAWLGLFAYTMQLYFDFSGYSDMAIGLAAMFGLEFPKNFDSPYRSRSITEFWRRWHMTLSQWLRDYLYIPLGGNRLGTRRTFINLFLTMLLGGLWHGASWMFALWGAYHGLLLAMERIKDKHGLLGTQSKFINTVFCFGLVMFGWALFRAHDFGMIGALFGSTGLGGIDSLRWVLNPVLIGVLFLVPILVWACPQSADLAAHENGFKAAAFSCLFVLALAKMIFTSFAPFLYYQF